MIRFHAFGTRLNLPLLTLITPLLAAKLGLSSDIFCVSLALSLHEIAHMLAAKLAGVRITQITLMPFGGSARMENPYLLPSYRIIPVAAAGPAGNLLAALLFAFLAHWNWISAVRARSYIQPNLILFLFNLLPVLPLDGGRILYALLNRALGEERALGIGLYLGRTLASALVFCFIVGGIRTGLWNLTLLLSAVFILASERDERAALYQTHAARLEQQLRNSSSPLPVRLYQVDEHTRLREALSLLRAHEGAWFVLLRDGAPIRLMDGRSIASALIQQKSPEATLGELANGFSLQAASSAINRL